MKNLSKRKRIFQEERKNPFPTKKERIFQKRKKESLERM